ncbi:hypothetical protein ALQ17_200052 [Pseudomonas fluorescens]|nr:hypothetical protein ALQ17_200052 [Pseudomonas fluorescens]
MDKPVRGSPLRGSNGLKNIDGRTLSNVLNLAPMPLARLAASKVWRRDSLMPIGASEVVSEPPAMPTSIWPRAILFATSKAASRPVPQACCTS